MKKLEYDVLQMKIIDRKNYRKRLHSCITKNKHTCEYLDCDINFLKMWLESNFSENMTFENYGKYWQVDHVIPCAKFNLTNDDEIAHCFRWTNLQPLTIKENLSKHDNINSEEIINHYKKVKLFAKKYDINLPKLNYKKYIELEI